MSDVGGSAGAMICMLIITYANGAKETLYIVGSAKQIQTDFTNWATGGACKVNTYTRARVLVNKKRTLKRKPRQDEKVMLNWQLIAKIETKNFYAGIGEANDE